VRYTAVTALVSLSPEANQELIQRLESLLQKKESEKLIDEEKIRLYFVIQSLGELKEMKAVGLLEKIVKVDDDWACRAFAAEALAEIGEVSALSSLREAREKEENRFALTKIEAAIEKLEGSPEL